MRNRVLALAALLSFLTLPANGMQAPARERIDVSQRGPQVGDRIPDFSLTDQSGNTWTRESIAGPNGTMLVFLRSADW